MENTVTLSLESYSLLLEENKQLKEQLNVIKNGYKIHIQYSSWYSSGKKYEIWNASESDKKLMDKIFELEKANQELKLNIHDIEKCTLWQLIKYKFTN